MSGAILIVDDSLTVRMDLAQAFAEVGIETRACGSLAEARAVLAEGGVGAVVLDLLLPDGDGVELLAELRQAPATASLPVLMLSSEAEVRHRVRGLQMGANDYVGKPYDTGYLVARARELIAGGGAVDAGNQAVLVMDDSPTYREELRRILREAGWPVITAASGEEGLRLAAQHRPAMIVVDGMMPDLDGPTVIRRLRLDAAMRGIPCVLLTGSDDGTDELRALDAGADAFVRKGEDEEVIQARLGAVLRGRAGQPAESSSLLGPKRVLAVDDSATYLAELAEMLRGEGYDVVPASSGEEALELLAVQPVDCILLDVLMPGLSGRETCRRIKAAAPLRDVPLIMLTALEDREALIEGLSAGADDYIAKSSDFSVLKARLRAQLRRKQFEDDHRRVRDKLVRSELEATAARAAQADAEARARLAEELERKNQELEAFSYSVSHDLRAPLRSIDGFSQALLEDYAALLDDRGRDYLKRVRAAAQRMGELIDDLLQLSRIGRAEMELARVDLSRLARSVADELRRRQPDHPVQIAIPDGIEARADGRLVRILLENLLDNAWKFTRRVAEPRVELAVEEEEGVPVYRVRDNGAGFDMTYAGKLFTPFQRLHRMEDFPGTGIGLATVQRVAARHGGRVWAESQVGKGTTISFTLAAPAAKKGGLR